MTVTVVKKLNPYFEIIGLIYDSVRPESAEEEAWKKSARNRGLNPEEINRKIGPVIRKYHAVFQKYRTGREMEDFDFFFMHEEPEFALFFQSICGEHPEWFEGELKEEQKGEVQLAFLREFSEEEQITEPPAFEKMVRILERAGYSGGLGWKFLLFLQEPVKKLQNLSRILKANFSAFEKAKEAVQKPLEKLMEDFQEGMEKEYLIAKISGDVTAFPTLVCPGAEVISSNPESTTAYIGLFVKDIYKMLEKSRNNRKHLLPVLKALSDSSKFEILQSLLISPKYNLEIAEELKLSPPTVSHHMSVLLENGLVDVEKKEGKVYYTLSKERLREAVGELEKIFSI